MGGRMDDINAIIAKHKGWNTKQILQGLSVEQTIWISPHGMHCLAEELPDFEHDPRLYMALFEEMPANTKLVKYEEYCSANLMYKCEIPNIETDVEFSIGTAICLAYMRLHGLECE